MTEAPTQPINPPDDAQVFEDYWGVDARERWYLPDGKQYFEFTVMTEGQKAEFQRKTSKDLVVQGRTGDARVAVDPAGDRHKLIKMSVVDWYLKQKGPDGSWTDAPFAPRTLDAWLDKANPALVEKLEFAIRMANPWMQADMTIEQIDEEIERLTEMRKQKEREELGEGRS